MRLPKTQGIAHCEWCGKKLIKAKFGLTFDAQRVDTTKGKFNVCGECKRYYNSFDRLPNRK